MKIEIAHQSVTQFDGDLLIINLFKGVKKPGGATGAIDKALNLIISHTIQKGELTGEIGETVVLHTFGKLPTDRVMIVGLGLPEKFGVEHIRKAAGSAAQRAQKMKAKRVGSIVHGAGIGGIDPLSAARSLIEGTTLALYKFTEYKKAMNSEISEFCIVEMDKSKIKKLQHGAELGKILAESQNVARDLINEPSNNLTPIKLNYKIKHILKNFGLEKRVEHHVLSKTALNKLKMGALLSVAQGSDNKPQFIILRYKNSNKPLVCLIGKTVTFDSGGISLKPAAGMARMKGDMSGGAAVIGATVALARTKSRVNLMTIIPAVENMPSGKASKPGDVVRAMNGKTIEIISTDAEGRMTLADALCYAEKKGAQTIIDIATLTGGCVVALGEITAAVMGSEQQLIDTVVEISKITAEKHWQLPLFEEYKEQMKSDVADLKNSGGRSASAITAGIFLQEFVSKAQWLHIDIAGKEIVEKENFYQPKGGTGFGVRTLFELCRRISQT
jgi:leucyl aminopeptidase